MSIQLTWISSAKLDLSPIQWLITMPLICSDAHNLLTRAFSLKPMEDVQASPWAALPGEFHEPSASRYIQEKLTCAKSKWDESSYKTRIDTALNTAFAQCFAYRDQPFTKIVVIGIETLELDYRVPRSNWKYATQHAFVFSLKNMLQELTGYRAGIELVFQNRGYTDITKNALEMQDPAVKVVGEDNLDQIFHIDDRTLLVSLGDMESPTKQIIAEYATATPCEQRLPRAIIWEEGVQVTWEDMEKLARQWVSPINPYILIAM